MKKITVLFLIICISGGLVLSRMSGNIALAQVNFTETTEPDILKITSPVNGSQLYFSTTQGPYIPTYYTDIPIKVSIKDTGKEISKVEFYRNDDLLGLSDRSPYTFNWSYPLRYPGTDAILKAKVIYTDDTFFESQPSNLRIYVSHVDDYSSPSLYPSPTPAPKIKISGYINPDHLCEEESAPAAKPIFMVEVDGTAVSVKTDKNGFFEISAPIDTRGYTLKITRPGYLERIINHVAALEDIQISSKESPIKLWAGDINNDLVINMTDLMEMAKRFNSATGDELYTYIMDYNNDNTINLADVIILAKNFIKNIKDYPVWEKI